MAFFSHRAESCVLEFHDTNALVAVTGRRKLDRCDLTF